MRHSRTQSVFKSLLNCESEMSLSRNATGREFQRHGPATEKLLFPTGGLRDGSLPLRSMGKDPVEGL